MAPSLLWPVQKAAIWVWLFLLDVHGVSACVCGHSAVYLTCASVFLPAGGWFLACFPTPPRRSAGQPFYMIIRLLIWTQSCQTLFGPRGQNLVWPETCWKVSRLLVPTPPSRYNYLLTRGQKLRCPLPDNRGACTLKNVKEVVGDEISFVTLDFIWGMEYITPLCFAWKLMGNESTCMSNYFFLRKYIH